MRKLLLLASAILLTLSAGYQIEANAQISVTKDNLITTFDDIETGTQYIILDNQLVPGLISQSGPDQVWDFTGLSYDATITGNYSTLNNPADAPGGDDEHFEDAVLVLDFELVSTSGFEESEGPDFFKSYTFLDHDEDNAYTLGSVTLMEENSEDLIVQLYRPARLDYVFPVTYGDSWAYDVVREQAMSDMTMDEEIEVTVEVDGWGELITPVGTFEVLRIKKEETQEIGGMEMTFTDFIFVDEYGRHHASIDNDRDASYYEYEFATSTEQDPEIAKTVTLEQNYPNPFNPSTSIQFSLPESNHATLSVYNMLGQRVALLHDGSLSAGNHTVTFDASQLSSGVYIYRLETGEHVETKSMMFIK